VSDIQRTLVRMLKSDEHFHPVPMPGLIDDNAQVDAALFLHADGVDNTSVGGFSFGFPVFDVNRRLAELIADEFQKIPQHPKRRSDNPTTDASRYYGFHHVHTPGPEVLIEHGFVTNPSEHAWLKAHVRQIAHAEHNALRRFFGFDPLPHPGNGHETHGTVATHTGPVTPLSALLAAPRSPAEKPIAYLLARSHGEYSDADVRNIVEDYYSTAPAVGLDPLLVVAQMVEETGHLTSFWSQRPRRNPAGIGVTGQPGEGLSFPDWKTAVRAHAGRLLAYALPKGSENTAQRILIAEALTFRPLPDSLRGVASTLEGLVGTWAKDPQYAKTLAAVANQIRSQAT
jgi:hypothetical protein